MKCPATTPGLLQQPLSGADDVGGWGATMGEMTGVLMLTLKSAGTEDPIPVRRAASADTMAVGDTTAIAAAAAVADDALGVTISTSTSSDSASLRCPKTCSPQVRSMRRTGAGATIAGDMRIRSSDMTSMPTPAFSATAWRNAICGKPLKVATVYPAIVAEKAT